MSSTPINGIKIRYFLINKEYYRGGGGLAFALCDAFLEELNKRRGGIPLESMFRVDHSDPRVVAIFDEKGSDWCAGGEQHANIFKDCYP
jgi:hypothetical protein